MTLLQNDAQLHALLPDGVYDDEAATQDAKRYVLVTIFDHQDIAVFNARAYESALYFVEAVTRSGILTNMRAAALRIDELLEDGTLDVPGFMGMWRERRERRVERDPVDKSIRWFRRGGFYRVQVNANP